jgi:hypothetical protein
MGEKQHTIDDVARALCGPHRIHCRELTFVLPDPRTQRLHLLHAYTYCNAAEETDGKANQLSVRHVNLRLLNSLHTPFAPARPRHNERPTFIGFLRLANGLE